MPREKVRGKEEKVKSSHMKHRSPDKVYRAHERRSRKEIETRRRYPREDSRNYSDDSNDRESSDKRRHLHDTKASKKIKREFDEKSSQRQANSSQEEKLKSGIKNDLDEPWTSAAETVSKEEKEKPNFEPSGKLAEDTNTYRGVVIKYNEPSDSHLPKLRWRLYPFKGDEPLPVLYIHRQSAYLIGRDRRIADLPVDHPSCSKQHAVFQYRLVSIDLPGGAAVKRVRPYIIDLGSANGTYLNNERIEPQRFVELREKDVLKFGFSTREFVLLNEKSHEVEEAESIEKQDLPNT